MSKAYVWTVWYVIYGEPGVVFDGVYSSEEKAMQRVDELNEYAGDSVANAKKEKLK